MQEIAPNVYIENEYAGVILGAINWSRGLVMVDAPFMPEDLRSWRSALLNLGGGMNRFLVTLDAHFDRTLGVRSMNCTAVGQQKLQEVFRERPVSFKGQYLEVGDEWEMYEGMGSIRWLPPEITFTEEMIIHLDDDIMRFLHRPGPSIGSSWIVLDKTRLAFIGDLVMGDEPPFLANADIPVWLETLEQLLTDQYADWLLVSSRCGIVNREQIKKQIAVLEKTVTMVEKLADRKAIAEDTVQLVPQLLKEYGVSSERKKQYEDRLRHGLNKYYDRFYGSSMEEAEEELEGK